MMKKLLILTLICTLASCTSVLPPNYNAITDSMMNADNNIKKISLGMTKEQVIAIMGEYYEIIGSKEGELLLGYKAYDYGIYKLRFINNKLTEWTKDWLPQYYNKESSYNSTETKDNSGMKAHLDAHRSSMLSTATSDTQRDAINSHMDAHSKAVLGE
ncbi:MAG: hypothetical protein ACK5M3_18350 [Dysgonomonas sp.]